MTHPALASPRSRPDSARLGPALERHFSKPSLRTLLGNEAAELDPSLWDRALRSPALEFASRPGKEFRANLVRQSYELAGGTGDCPEALALVVETLHAGSLIVDDIQDQSATRRDGPALHVVHGMPVALNVGNWMYFLALRSIDDAGLDAAASLSLYRQAHATLLRCHHGQALDLTATVSNVPQREMQALVTATSQLKTGALMEFAARSGATAAGAPEHVVEALGALGRNVGVILQMLDDLGGLTSVRRCHKGHEDLELGRPTWPWAWLSAELAPARYAKLREESAQVRAGDRHPELLARTLRRELRGSGRVRIRRQVHATCARLEAVLGIGRGARELRAQLQRMERSYD